MVVEGLGERAVSRKSIKPMVIDCFCKVRKETFVQRTEGSIINERGRQLEF